MTQKKSLFLIGNMLRMVAMTSSPALVGASVNDAIRDTPLSVPDTIEGLKTCRTMLGDAEKSRGANKDLYDAIGDIQQTLIGKAEQAGLTDQQMKQYDEFDTSKEFGAGLGIDQTTIAGAAQADRALGGGAIDDRVVHHPVD